MLLLFPPHAWTEKPTPTLKLLVAPLLLAEALEPMAILLLLLPLALASWLIAVLELVLPLALGFEPVAVLLLPVPLALALLPQATLGPPAAVAPAPLSPAASLSQMNCACAGVIRQTDRHRRHAGSDQAIQVP